MARAGAVLFLLLLAAPPLHACTCLIADPKTSFKRSAAVFLGEVVSYDGTIATLRVVEWFKGPRSATIEITTIDAGTTCGYGASLEPGTRHLIYAYISPGNSPEVSACTRSASEERASCDLAHLRSRAGWWRSPLSSLRILKALRVRWEPCPQQVSADASLPLRDADAPG